VTGWLVDGLIPAGALVTIVDCDDGTPQDALARGFDVVIHLGRSRLDDEPTLVTVFWRDGLVPGREPPAPFWIRFDRERQTFVRVERPVRVHAPPRDPGGDHEAGFS
jgi:hypothetical protein